MPSLILQFALGDLLNQERFSCVQPTGSPVTSQHGDDRVLLRYRIFEVYRDRVGDSRAVRGQGRNLAQDGARLFGADWFLAQLVEVPAGDDQLGDNDNGVDDGTSGVSVLHRQYRESAARDGELTLDRTAKYDLGDDARRRALERVIRYEEVGRSHHRR